LQSPKHFSPRDSTEAGIKNDVKDEQFSNVSDSIRLTLDPNPKITDARDRQRDNEPSPRDSTEGGIEIVSNFEQSASAQRPIVLF
jgi:hypothetical protein